MGADVEVAEVAEVFVGVAAPVAADGGVHGEVPVAAVVAHGEIGADELMAWVAERVAPHKRVRGVRFVDEIPKTPSGKVLRRLLAERATGRVG